jgi:hypothetical protein
MLFDISPYRASVPEGVQVYASGSNRRPEIDGFARLGIPVGVSANQLNEDVLATELLPGYRSEIAWVGERLRAALTNGECRRMNRLPNGRLVALFIDEPMLRECP